MSALITPDARTLIAELDAHASEIGREAFTDWLRSHIAQKP